MTQQSVVRLELTRSQQMALIDILAEHARAHPDFVFVNVSANEETRASELLTLAMDARWYPTPGAP
jgi:hypothetical protein